MIGIGGLFYSSGMTQFGHSVARIELGFVGLPARLHGREERLIFGIGVHAGVVVISHKPRVIAVAECDSAAEHGKRRLSLAKESIDFAEPIGLIAIKYLVRPIAEQPGVDFVALVPGGVDIGSSEAGNIVARVAGET